MTNPFGSETAQASPARPKQIAIHLTPASPVQLLTDPTNVWLPSWIDTQRPGLSDAWRFR